MVGKEIAKLSHYFVMMISTTKTDIIIIIECLKFFLGDNRDLIEIDLSI